ncbi:iron-containing alcohol dehydrogenase [Caproiciproducens sp. R2]|uniref:iron-containing alcohol dehydrogenase n=1 Tax=Caproiciproducens sp. R2 TaxID=3435187 RepID=UPI004034BE4D
MLNFKYSIPTEIFFGKGQISALSDELLRYGNSVLLVYGGGSIKRTGLYDTVVRLLADAKIAYWELGGVEPNPRIDTVRAGAQLCKENGIDTVLAIGGGSSIDCAKVVAAAANYDGDAWDLVLHPDKIGKVLLIAAVLTIAATGSEMDRIAVISNMATNEKLATSHDGLRPRFAVMDPEYTYTVPKYQTASGTADIFSHVLESYFVKTPGVYLQRRFCEALLKTCLHYGPKAMTDPENYEARANLMWASSLAINDLITYGTERRWTVHPIEHVLSAHYDITHGVGLAVLTPSWMRFVCGFSENLPYFAEYGVNVWNLTAGLPQEVLAQQAIEKTEGFFEALGLPKHLSELGIPFDLLEPMAEQAAGSGRVGGFQPLSKEDVFSILKMSY